VTSERQKVKKPSEDNKPINLFDLELERREAAIIIERVNKKAKELKRNLEEAK